MTHFEYLTVAYAIVLGLGITHILGRLREFLAPESRSWMHVGWVSVVLLAHLQMWWGFWDVQVIAWSLLSFCYFLVQIGFLYVCATVLIPRADPYPTNWEYHFFDTRRWFFGAFLGYTVFASASSWIFLGAPLAHPYRLFQLAFFAAGVIGWCSANRRVHQWVVAALLAVFIAGQLLFRLRPGLFSAG